MIIVSLSRWWGHGRLQGAVKGDWGDAGADLVPAGLPRLRQEGVGTRHYTGVARAMAQGLKYNDRTDLAPWMARWMLRAGAELIADADIVVPLPLHWRRFVGRRYNQSAELGRAVATLAALPFHSEALRRRKMTKRQVGLHRREREDNVRGAFQVPPETEIHVRGRRVLLVDDVYTTGATAAAASRALKRGGAAAVDVLTFARVLPGDFRPDEVTTI